MGARTARTFASGVAGTVLLWGLPASAGIGTELERYVGYTIAAAWTITGWVSEDGEQKGDSFEGCQYGRKIIFDNGKYLTCETYSYSYSYRPTAVILTNGGRIVMIVEDEAYDMR